MAQGISSLAEIRFSRPAASSAAFFHACSGPTNADYSRFLELYVLLSEPLDMPALTLESQTRRASDQDCFIANIDQSELMLGWIPEISCSQGEAQTLSWIRTQISPC